MNIVLLTGCSGAGKSRAANILEDWGYTCVDNIPLTMISVLVDMHRKDATSGDKLAIVTDVRCTTDFRALSPLVQSLREAGDICRVVYLDCRDDVLINRYKFTRRLHPLTLRYGTGMEDALLRERQMLRDAYECADVRIDTSDITPAQLTQILEHALAGETHNGIYICCMSFGFKYGIPPEADTVFDVRCFPNPYHVEGLREKNGLHPEVNAYVFSFPETHQYIERLRDYFLFMLPLYEKEGKKQFTVAVGCTGGQHRSVAIADRLNTIFLENGYNSVVIHRNMDGAYGSTV